MLRTGSALFPRIAAGNPTDSLRSGILASRLTTFMSLEASQSEFRLFIALKIANFYQFDHQRQGIGTGDMVDISELLASDHSNHFVARD